MRILPGEFEKHERTVLCWPARRDLYGERFAEAERAHALVANAIAEFEPVTVLVDPEFAGEAAAACGRGVSVVEMDMDDSWFRDTGPIYVRDTQGDQSTIVATDWIFNGWGNKFQPHDKDATLASRWCALRGDIVERIAMVFEGGSINSNGQGIIATTEQCLLNPNRNPTLSKAQIEATMQTALGAKDVMWLPYGLALDADTDGHVDNVAAFADPRTLVLQMCEDDAEEDAQRLAANRNAALEFIDATGNEIRIVEVPVLPFVDTPQGRVVVPYLNYYLGNGFVLVPVCGHPADSDMLDLIASAHPNRRVIGLEVGEILAVGGGGIHCITQQIPAV